MPSNERKREISLRQGFATRLRQFRETALKGSTQEEVAALINVSQPTYSRWESGKSTPTLSEINKMATLWGRNEVLRLCGFLPPNEYNGFEWFEDIPDYIDDHQRGLIEKGLEFFRLLIVRQATVEECIAELAGDWQLLNRCLLLAIKARCLQIGSVPREESKERALRQYYGKQLRDVIVAKVPKYKDGRFIDGAIVRTECVTFLAATQVLSQLNLDNASVGIGDGSTMYRFAQYSALSGRLFSSTKWVSLTAAHSQTIDNNPYSANSIVSLLRLLHLGSTAARLPYLSSEQAATLLEAPLGNTPNKMKLAYKIIKSFDNLTAVFMTIGGENHGRILSEESFSIRRRDELTNILRKKKLLRQLAGDILGFIRNDEGSVIDDDLESINRALVFSMDLHQLQRLAQFHAVWVIAAMGYKSRAIYMALKRGYLNSLVIDEQIADYLIHQAEKNA